MKLRKSSSIRFTLVFLGLLALALIFAFAAFAVMAWLAGWLLRLVLPLTLFEGMLLGLLLLVVSGSLVFKFVSAMLPEPWAPDQDEPYASIGEDEEMHPIPATRFFSSMEERTWEAWLRYEMANDIFLEFGDSPRKPSTLNDAQLQELSIRLAEIGIAVLKRKSPRTASLAISASALKREMQRIGQQAYDADILAIGAEGVNTTIDFYSFAIIDLLENKHWQSPAKVPDYG